MGVSGICRGGTCVLDLFVVYFKDRLYIVILFDFAISLVYIATTIESIAVPPFTHISPFRRGIPGAR